VPKRNRSSDSAVRSNLAKVDAHTIRDAEYEERPELTDEMLSRGVMRGLGRPRSTNPRQLITLRLPSDVIAAWRATGKGWQTRMAERLQRSSLPPEAGADRELRLPPSSLSNDDWVRIYGEEYADWMTLTPAARWRQSARLWTTYRALGGRLDDEPTANARDDRAVGHATASGADAAHGRTGVYRVRRLGV